MIREIPSKFTLMAITANYITQTEVLKKAARELEVLRMASVKQELAMLDRPGLLERMTGANQVITDDLLEDSYSAGYKPATNQPNEDWL